LKRLLCLFFILPLIFISCEKNDEDKLQDYFSKERLLHLTFTKEDFSITGKMKVTQDKVSFSPDEFLGYVVEFDASGGRIYYEDMVFEKGYSLSVFKDLFYIIKAKNQGDFSSFGVKAFFEKGAKMPCEIQIGNVKLSDIEEVK